MCVIKAGTHGCVRNDSETHSTGVTGLHSRLVQSSNTVSCVSLSFRTHPCVLAIYPPNAHNGHPIAYPWGWGVGCLLWVQSLINVPSLSLQCHLQDRVTLGHTPDCTSKSLLYNALLCNFSCNDSHHYYHCNQFLLYYDRYSETCLTATT